MCIGKGSTQLLTHIIIIIGLTDGADGAWRGTTPLRFLEGVWHINACTQQNCGPEGRAIIRNVVQQLCITQNLRQSM